jgi:hypothetical protein
MNANSPKRVARRLWFVQMLRLHCSTAGFFFVIVMFFSGCFDSEPRPGVNLQQKNLIPSPTGCNETSTHESDSVFRDFDLFDQSPRCPIRGNSYSYPFLKVVNSNDKTNLKVCLKPKSERNLFLNRQERFSVLADTTVSKNSNSRRKARLNWFLFTKGVIVHLKYYSYTGPPFQWCLSEAEAMKRDFVSITSISFDWEPDSVGVVPKLESISGLTGLIYRSREDSLIIQSYCLRGFCSNTTVSMKKEKSNVDNSIFWHWLIPALH